MSKNYLLVLNKTDKNRYNCVKWARGKVLSLPTGLWTIQDKKKIINDHSPDTGSIAIMNVGLPWGHVGIITEVGRNHITIKEANYKAGKVTERHGRAVDLKIIGYFNPRR